MGRWYHRNTLTTFSLKQIFKLKEVCLQKISWYSLWAKCGLPVRSNLTIPFMLPSFTSAKTQPYYLYYYSEMTRFVPDGMHSLQVYNNSVESTGVSLCKIKWLHVDNNMLWWSWFVAVWCASIMQFWNNSENTQNITWLIRDFANIEKNTPMFPVAFHFLPDEFHFPHLQFYLQLLQATPKPTLEFIPP